ncbi:NADPH:quinone oxidoreductase 2 [Salmonella enterica subsp. enterica]|uniref:NADPH:quinone oxidoreductase 2 n=1 Tax=Salmonella enterica I TaxID=59201 RepID=A0A447MZ76_SALET|nr:NADPH:quinone oxidoreductase 2 [Salmonella enterica subsp. enterica]
MIAITGATGQLGQHVIENLLKTTPASHLVAIVRNPKKAARSVSAGSPFARRITLTKPR